jgi:hypothetical protein
MTGKRHTQLVKEHADLILSSEPDIHAYMIHFEAQLRRNKIRRLLYASYLEFIRAGEVLAGLDPQDIYMTQVL